MKKYENLSKSRLDEIVEEAWSWMIFAPAGSRLCIFDDGNWEIFEEGIYPGPERGVLILYPTQCAKEMFVKYLGTESFSKVRLRIIEELQDQLAGLEENG